MSGDHKSVVSATPAWMPILYFAGLQGAAVIACGALPYLALTGVAFLALPLRLPCALFGLVNGAVRRFPIPGWRRSRND